jgi:hypothetical protein
MRCCEGGGRAACGRKALVIGYESPDGFRPPAPPRQVGAFGLGFLLTGLL